MWSNQYLPGGRELRSANGRYTLVYQGDGNLVLYKNYPYHDRKWLWDSARFSAPGRCIMQADGNLVVYNAAGGYVWDTATNGKPGAYLTVQDDGNAVVYRPNGPAIWASNTVQPPLPVNGPTATGAVMLPGQVLHPGNELRTSTGAFALILQPDGNLVLYRNYGDGHRKALWATGTNGKRVEVCIMQADGNLVMYGPDGEYVWDSNTAAPGGRLQLHPEGNLAIHNASGGLVWQTDTPRVEYFKSFGDDGWVSLTIRPNGTVRFQGHQRNGNIIAESCDFRVGVFVKFETNRALALYETGHLGTKTSPGGSPIDRKWDRTEQSDLVTDHYEKIERDGHFKAEQERQGMLSDLLESVLDVTLRWVIGDLILSTGIGQIILLGAALWSRFGDPGSIPPGVRFVEGAFWLAGPQGTVIALVAAGLGELEADGQRELHPWEYEFGQQVFKGTLPPKDKMRVTNHMGLENGREFVYPALGKILMHLGPKLAGATDPSHLNDDDRITWVHELTHAWQIQHNALTGSWLADGILSQAADFLGVDAYEVDWNDLQPFGSYNLEQQAEIVERWFKETQGGVYKKTEPEDHFLYHYMVEHVWMGRP